MHDSEFDEPKYLTANPDVAVAVRDGKFSSGFDHYLKFGKREGRGFSGEGLYLLKEGKGASSC